jgi:hypothetical protein
VVIRKVLFGAAIAFSVAAGVATPASADPSSFGTLGCSCQPPVVAPPGKAPATDQMNQGIQNGLGYLHGSASRPNDN